EQNIIFSEELKKLQKMKEEMDRLWKKLFVETPNRKEEEGWQWCERLQKFEGAGRKSSPPRLNKTVK
ncbi:MAG: hypothetical protein ACXU9X_15405, partial [Thermodesulfobacteriota bacterium]